MDPLKKLYGFLDSLAANSIKAASKQTFKVEEQNKEMKITDVPKELKRAATAGHGLHDFVDAFIEAATGPKGVEGEKGEKGAKGDKGDRGQEGKQGKDGKQGIKGEKGDQGEPGQDGIDGLNGFDGKNGKDGSPDTPSQIVSKLESLEGDERLDAKAIRNLDSILTKVTTGMRGYVSEFVPRKIIDLADAPNSLTGQSGKVLSVKTDETGFELTTGSGGGGVSSTGTITDNGIVIYSGTTGNTIKSTGITVESSGVVAGTGSWQAGGIFAGATNVLTSTNSTAQVLSSTSSVYAISVAQQTRTEAVNGSFWGMIVRQTTITEAASGTHPAIGAVAIRAPIITNGSATTTNGVTLYIEGAPSGTATVTNNYALWVDAGEVRIDGDIGDTTNRVTKGWFTDVAVSNTITGSVSGNAATATALATGRTINGTTFDGTANITVTAAAGTLTGTTLNATVVTSSLTSVGTIATGVWNGTAVGVAYGGTGQTTYTDGQLLIGNSSGSTLTKATLTGTSNQVVVTNGNGSITLSLPQSIATSSTPQFGRLGLGQAADSSAVMAATGQYFSTRYALTDNATIALDWNNGNVQSVTLGGNRTFTFANPKDGARYSLIIKQDGTGSRTLTWPTIKWAAGTTPTLTTTAAKYDIFSFIYDGTNYYGTSTLNF